MTRVRISDDWRILSGVPKAEHDLNWEPVLLTFCNSRSTSRGGCGNHKVHS